MSRIAVLIGVALAALSNGEDAFARTRLGKEPLISVKCQSRAVLPLIIPADASPEVRAQHEADWKKYEEEDEDCWVYSPAKDQWYLIETEKAARERIAKEPKFKEIDWAEVDALISSTRKKTEASAVREKPATKKAEAPLKVTRGALVCDGTEQMGVPAGVFRKAKSEKEVLTGYVAQPSRPVDVLGFRVVELYARFVFKPESGTIVTRVVGSADAVSSALRKVHPKATEPAVDRRVTGLRTNAPSTRYVFKLSPIKASGAKRALSIEQAIGTEMTDIICVLRSK